MTASPGGTVWDAGGDEEIRYGAPAEPSYWVESGIRKTSSLPLAALEIRPVAAAVAIIRRSRKQYGVAQYHTVRHHRESPPVEDPKRE